MEQNNQSDFEVLLMQPKEPPHQLLSTLIEFFKNRTQFVTAYFAVVQFSYSLDSMDYLIAIDVRANVAAEIKEVQKYLNKVNFDTGGKKIAIVDVNQNPFDSYFSKITPFYKK